MDKLSKQIRDHLERESVGFLELPGDDDPNRHLIYVPFDGKNCNVVCRVSVHDDLRAIRVIASGGILVPVSQVGKISKVMAKMNYAISQGAFCMDPADLVFTQSLVLGDFEPTDGLMRNLTGNAAGVYDYKFPEFAKLIYGKSAAKRGVDSNDEPSLENMQAIVERLLGEHAQDNPEDSATPIKRKRGRPRKRPGND